MAYLFLNFIKLLGLTGLAPSFLSMLLLTWNKGWLIDMIELQLFLEFEYSSPREF